MADLEFFQEKYGCGDEDEAFRVFRDGLRNYLDKDYYVDWEGVQRKIRPKRAVDEVLGETRVSGTVSGDVPECP